MRGPDVSDPSYWRHRAATMRRLAADSDDPFVRIHLEGLAAAYEEIAELAQQLAREVEPE
jgi:hypothetical protein